MSAPPARLRGRPFTAAPWSAPSRGPFGVVPVGSRVRLPMNNVHSMVNTVHPSRSAFKETEVEQRRRATSNTPVTTAPGAPATDGRSPSLWFGASTDDQDRRPQLTRERVVEEALTVIAHDGANALTMRRLAARLGVVPGALYNHVRNKQQLHDLLLDGVLAEVDLDPDPALGWTEKLKVLPTGSVRCSRTIPAWLESSRPATRWDRTPWP